MRSPVGVTIVVGLVGTLMSTWAVAPASAATLSLAAEPGCRSGCGQIAQYRASPGEINRATFSAGESSFEVADPGASIRAGSGCQVTAPGRASCGSRVLWVEASLGDGSDRADASAFGDGGAFLNGDAGNDHLIGGTSDENGLTGGSGSDVLEARSTETTAEYQATRQPIRADLATGLVRVGPADRDRLVGIHDVIGGHGGDRLAGTTTRNRIDGGPGNDVVMGRGGDDGLAGSRGRDLLDGGRGDDSLNESFGAPGPDGDPDRARCGAGRDRIIDTDLSDRVGRDCELATPDGAYEPFHLPPADTPRPTVYLSRLCDGTTLDLRLRLRIASSGETIARRRHRCPRSGRSRRVRLVLRPKASGRRLLRGRRPVQVRVEVALGPRETDREGFTVDLSPPMSTGAALAQPRRWRSPCPGSSPSDRSWVRTSGA